MSDDRDALACRDLAVSYGAISAVDGIDVQVGKAECVAILGANGAGKSSLLNAVMGVVSAQGSVRLNGEEISGQQPHERVRGGLAIVPEGRRVIGTLDVSENLTMGGYWTPPDRRRELLDEMFELFPMLAERRKQVSSTLSGGEQQMLAIARALMSDPDVLLMDEPTMGLAPLIVEDVMQAITRVGKDRGISILVVEQNARAALQVAARAYVMATGSIVHHGTAAEIADAPELVEAYLS